MRTDKTDRAKRGDTTRQALIEAGLELFGEYGFKAASTRMLADMAGANIAAIPYYFGGKEGLYRAVVEHIVERVTGYMGLTQEALWQAKGQKPLKKTDARQYIRQIVEKAAHMFVDSDEPKKWALIVIREQVKPTEVFDVFHEGMMKKMHGRLSYLIAVAAGLDPDGAEARIRAHTVLGQILIFLCSRETILRQLGVKKLSSTHVDLIHQVIQAQVDALLNVPSVTKP